jgi:hypothetical protein
VEVTVPVPKPSQSAVSEESSQKIAFPTACPGPVASATLADAKLPAPPPESDTPLSLPPLVRLEPPGFDAALLLLLFLLLVEPLLTDGFDPL